jgi:protein involved in polysaccharide export with SLBB domain
MQVNIWGVVEKPGRYEIPTSTDLIQLVSYAGGPGKDADLGSVRVTRFLKREGGVNKMQFTINLDDLHQVEDAKLVLYPGDTIFIDHTGWVTLRDVFGVVTTAALVTAAVAQIINATNR